MCGVAAKTSTLKILSNVENVENVWRQRILVFYQWKNGVGVAT
jgi:hypothetical protein